MEDEKQFAALIYAFCMSSVIGVAVGVLRGVIQEKYAISWQLMLRGILASILVAVFVGFALEDFESLSVTMKVTIIGVSSFIADDILLGLLALGRVLGRDPFGFLSRVLSAYKGQIKDEFTTKEMKINDKEKSDV